LLEQSLKNQSLKNLVLASLLGFLSVMLGAFGAHALEEMLSPEALKSYETGVRYMMTHSIVLLFINSSSVFGEKTRKTLSYLFFSGILLFSGSIFAISLGLVEARNIWFVTPLGGLLLLAGWMAMAIALVKYSKEKK